VAGTAAAAEPLSIPLTVAEPAGVARTACLATGGVPFRPGQVRNVSQLALLDAAGKSVAAQFTRLAGYEDGSVQWALVDLLCDVAAGGKAAFRVQRGTPAAPPTPLEITETADRITVKTADTVYTIAKADFRLLESVTVAGRKVAGPGRLQVVDGAGRTFQAGRPTRLSWEYRGPVRATLRVEGPYLDEKGAAFLAHTTRLTFTAGRTAVRVDHSLRNSDPKAGFDAAIRQATIQLAITDPDALVIAQHTGGCFPGDRLHLVKRGNDRVDVFAVPPADTPPKGRRGPLYGYDMKAGVFMLADRAHKDTRVWVDFAAPRTADQQAARRKALLGDLHALADPQWISRTEALGCGHFGTLTDEMATYRKWGWKGWDDPKKHPRSPHRPDAYVAKTLVHNVSETDCAEGYVLMYVRTGQRGFLDLARAWAGYYKTHYGYRTDGFDFAARRPSKGLKFGWYGPQKYGWNDSRSESCHFYGRGIFDYYCLTGDVDALEGGRDLVEQVAAWSARYKPGSSVGYYGCRGYARMWLAAIRLAQLTRDPADRKVADRMAEVSFKAPDWDPRGFFFWGAGPRYLADHWLNPSKWPKSLTEYMDRKGFKFSKRGIVTAPDGTKYPVRSDGGTWQQSTFQLAYERYHRLTGSQEAKRRAIRTAEFTRDYQWSKKCQFVGYYTLLDFPEKDRVYDPGEWLAEHKNCPGPGAKHSGWYTRFAAGVFARAYSLSGDPKWLQWAKKAWNRGSKRGYMRTQQAAADDEVHVFAHHVAPKDDTAMATSRMFYEVPRAGQDEP
jgi:hypothetical protein